jgi:Arc/MetJ family transcription regulator
VFAESARAGSADTPCSIGQLAGGGSSSEVYTSCRYCTYFRRCVVAKKLIDIDIELLERAKEIIGAETYKETVNAGLREIIATAARRREIERLLDPEPSDIEDPEIMAQAWR